MSEQQRPIVEPCTKLPEEEERSCAQKILYFRLMVSAMLGVRDFPVHVQLMLLAARHTLRADEEEDLRLLVAGAVDWPAFLDVTRHHRVGSLVSDCLERLRPAGVPGFVSAQLHAGARQNALAAFEATVEVTRILEQFDEVMATGGVPLTVLKGVQLSQMLYGSPNLREVGDLDLLTVAAELPEQIAVLDGLGYMRTNPSARLTPQRLRSYVGYWKDFTFRNESNGFELDLHWRLFNHRLHAGNRILNSAEYTTGVTFGKPMRVLSARDQFLHIVAHGLSDAWVYLKTLADVSGFLRLFSPAELERAIVHAESLGLLPQVSAAVHLANAWMGCQADTTRLLPEQDGLARSIREHTEALLRRHMFKPVRNHPSPAEWLKIELTLVPGLASAAELALRYAWRPRVWLNVDLPDRWFWMYGILGLLVPPRLHTTEDAARS